MERFYQFRQPDNWQDEFLELMGLTVLFMLVLKWLARIAISRTIDL